MIVIAGMSLFGFSVLYAVLGNAAVYFILRHREVPMRSIWAGTPGYLYRVCCGTSVAGLGLRRFALSTNIAGLLAFLLGLALIPVFQGA
jgi:hypothetical protein